MRPGRRLTEFVIVAVVASTLAVTLANHRVNPSTLPTGAELAGVAQSSALYCTGFSGVAGLAPAEVLFTNTTAHPLPVHVTIIANTSVTSTRTVTVGRDSVARLTAHTFPGRALYGVTAIVGGGGVTAQVVGEGLNHDSAPCASAGAPTWGLAGLSTHVGTTTYLTLLNPTHTEATVNIAAFTPRAVVTPGSFQGIVVGPQAVVALPLNSEVVDESSIALSIRATRGTVIAGAAMAWTGRVTGAATIAATPGFTRTRVFPDLPTNSGAVSTLELVNPTPLVESVSVAMTIGSSPLTPGPADATAITPFSVTLPAFAQSALALSPSTRVPAGGPASVIVHASGAVIAQLLTRQVGQGPWFSPAATPGTYLTIAGGFTQLGNLLIVNRTNHVATVSLRFLRAHGTALTEHVTIGAHAVAAVAPPSRTAAYESVVMTSSVPVTAAGAISGRPNGVRIVVGSGGG